MRRRPLVLVPALLLVPVLAACGGSSGHGMSVGSGATASPSAKAAALKPKTAKALTTEVTAALKALATDEETYLTDKDDYLAFQATVPAPLTSKVSDDFIYGAVVRGKTSYCLVGVLKGTDRAAVYDSAKGGIQQGTDYAADCAHLAQSLALLAKKVAGPSVAPASPGDVTAGDQAKAQLSADLRNLATAEETYLTDNDKYLAFQGTVPPGLTEAGFKPSKAGAFRYGGVVRNTSDSYCLVAYDPTSKAHVAYDSDTGGVTTDDSDLAADCKALLAKVTG